MSIPSKTEIVSTTLLAFITFILIGTLLLCRMAGYKVGSEKTRIQFEKEAISRDFGTYDAEGKFKWRQSK